MSCNMAADFELGSRTCEDVFLFDFAFMAYHWILAGFDSRSYIAARKVLQVCEVVACGVAPVDVVSSGAAFARTFTYG